MENLVQFLFIFFCYRISLKIFGFLFVDIITMYKILEFDNQSLCKDKILSAVFFLPFSSDRDFGCVIHESTCKRQYKR